MNWVRQWFKQPSAKQVTQWSDEIARHSEALVLNRVEQRVARMSANEAAGYIRSHAVGVVEQRLAATVPSSANQKVRAQIVDQAVDLVITRALRICLKPARASTPHVRRAA